MEYSQGHDGIRQLAAEYATLAPIDPGVAILMGLSLVGNAIIIAAIISLFRSGK